MPDVPDRTPWRGWRGSGENAGLPAAKGAGSRRPFGATWWGKAWLEALEQRARLDPNRLGRGRSYARRGSVLELTVDPGVVRAEVQGSRVTPYGVTVKIRAFSDAEWDAVLDVVSAQIGRVAALLDGELPPELVEDVQAAGLELLPTAGEVRTACNCPDFAVPCKHSAAVCYLIADELDEDPFALMLLRGRRRDELLAALRSRRTSVSGEPLKVRTRPVGVLARQAFAAELSGEEAVGRSHDVPVPPRPGAQAGVPAAVLALAPPRASGVEGQDLVALATDAARRAWELAVGDGNGGLRLTFEQDLARRAASMLGTSALADLAHRAGVSSRQLTSWAVAWREAGAAGLAVATETSPAADGVGEDQPGATGTVSAEQMAEGIAALSQLAGGRRVVVDGNRVSLERQQLRLGQDGLWYLFTEHFGDWTLAGPPAADPAELLNR
ncbi:SWIM zinc finger family protein [Kribbella flavida]|uniref:SWIM zinc finger family protein n=1 Tax=Kribbella flavida TaxID=182640 RepID=UPI001ED8EE84|nr:SWIM zinc finger family protein [Kribbella flavida]